MCPKSELKMSLPVTLPGHNVTDYQSVLENEKGRVRSSHYSSAIIVTLLVSYIENILSSS